MHVVHYTHSIDCAVCTVFRRSKMTHCRDLLSIPSLRNLQLLGGKKGLTRPMNWVYFILSQPFGNWVNYGDLIFYNPAGRDTSEDMLLSAIQEAELCGLAGLIFLLDPDLLPQLPDSVALEADRLAFPVFSLSITENINNISRDIITYIVQSNLQEKRGTSFWKKLLFEEASAEDPNLLTQAYINGINPRQSYCLYLFQFCNLPDYFKLPVQQRQVADPAALLSGFYSKIRFFLSGELTNYWLVEHQESCAVILHVSPSGPTTQSTQLFLSIVQKLEKQYPGARIRVAKGSLIFTLEQAPRSYIEAQRAIYIENLYPEELPYIDYSKLGFQRLLYEISDVELLRRYVEDTIGSLLLYDLQNHTDYYLTLLTYYRQMRNLTQTAQILNYHRNSMILRMQKIEEITGLDLSDHNHFYNIYVALEIYEYLKKLENET